jgi:hypothetical protein
MKRILVVLNLFFSLNSFANDYKCVGIGGENSNLWAGRELIFRFLDAIDLKFIDMQTAEEIPLSLDRVYTTGNQYLAQNIYFFMTSGLISTFKPIEKGKINMTTFDSKGYVSSRARLDCILIYH